MDTSRAQYREAIAQIAAKAQAKLPECNGRVEKAVGLVLQGDVELHADGTVTVHSQADPTRHYKIVEGACMCQDWKQAPHHFCKHRLAAGIARRVQELCPTPPVAPEPEVELPADFEPSPDNDPEGAPEPLPPAAAPAPLPEAPASANVRVQIAGREVQLTLRDTDETRLLVRLQAVLAQYPVPQPPAPPASQGPTPGQGKAWCPVHGVQMQRHENAKGVWYSHYIDGKHCKGR